jgi:hypothetical protein
MVRANAISVAITKIRWTVDKSARFARINTKVAATEIRSSNKPIPGPPGGNIENSRCTLVSLSALNSAAHPKCSYTPITLLGDAWRWPSGVRRGDQETIRGWTPPSAHSPSSMFRGGLHGIPSWGVVEASAVGVVSGARQLPVSQGLFCALNRGHQDSPSRARWAGESRHYI